MTDYIEKMGVVSAAVLPLFNTPLILKIIRRKSSSDMSLTWAIGVWVCIVFMTPQALRTNDLTLKIFGISNLIFFSFVVFFILKYRSKP